MKTVEEIIQDILENSTGRFPTNTATYAPSDVSPGVLKELRHRGYDYIAGKTAVGEKIICIFRKKQ